MVVLQSEYYLLLYLIIGVYILMSLCQEARTMMSVGKELNMSRKKLVLEGGREGGRREGGTEGGREGGMEGGREGGREGWREGGREKGWT